MFRLMKNFTIKHWIINIVVVGLVVVQSISALQITNNLNELLYFSQNKALPDAAKMINTISVRMIGYAVLAGLLTILITYLSAYISSEFGRIVRKKIYSKVQNFSIEEINKFSTASLITRSTNDVTQVQNTVGMFLRNALSGPIMAVGGIIMARQLSTNITLVSVIVIVVAVLISFFVMLFLIVFPRFGIIQKLTDKLNLVTRENLTGLRVIRSLNSQDEERKKFETVSESVRKQNTFVNRMFALFNPFMTIMIGGGSLSIIWLGAYIVNKGELQVNSMFTFQQFAITIIFSFMSVVMLFIMIPRANVSGKRINEVLNTVTKINDPTSEEEFSEIGTIEFDNVGFKYPDAEESTLENISFKVKKGETCAFIGGTGSGKSTLINLIPRLFNATSGIIKVDGVDIKKVSQHNLRAKIGYIPQKGVLFTGTVKSNLVFGNPKATDEEISKAIKTSQAEEFVNSLKEGIDAPIAQGGTNVSGGQKQRLNIARAVIKNPEIYIFDDTFSALDFKTDKLLRKALSEETKDATKLIVAQRIGTIIDADQIIVLDEGKIVGIGTHSTLMQTCEVYREIAYSQLSKEELENE